MRHSPTVYWTLSTESAHPAMAHQQCWHHLLSPLKMSTKIHPRMINHRKCPREFTLRKCPLEFAHFFKKKSVHNNSLAMRIIHSFPMSCLYQLKSDNSVMLGSVCWISVALTSHFDYFLAFWHTIIYFQTGTHLLI